MYQLWSLNHDGYDKGRETDDFVTALMWATETLANADKMGYGMKYNQSIRIYYDGAIYVEVEREGAKKVWEEKVLPTFAKNGLKE